MIVKDLSHLPEPTETTAVEGEPPDDTPRFVHLLAEQTPPRTARDDTRLRTSDAGRCARAVGYRAAGIDRSNDTDIAGRWTGVVSDLVKRAWRDALQHAYPDAAVSVSTRADDVDLGGWIDAVIDTDTARIAVALNTTGGWAFKSLIGVGGGTQPTGPSYTHKVEAALNAVAVDADELVIGFLATETVSQSTARYNGIDTLGRFAAEWTYQRATFEPWAKGETQRLAGILALGDQGLLPARKIPELPTGAVIADPSTGVWVRRTTDGTIDSTGSTWHCGYCGWRDLCATTAAGRIPITETKVELGGAA